MTQNFYTLKIKIPKDDPKGSRTIHKSRGAKSKIGICKFIALLLEVNETLPKYRKMTDERLRRIVLDEYPDRTLRKLRNGKITIGHYRTLFNLGKLVAPYGTHPDIPSNRYLSNGVVANRSAGRPPVQGDRKAPSPLFFLEKDNARPADECEGRPGDPGVESRFRRAMDSTGDAED